jgi:lysozyme
MTIISKQLLDLVKAFEGYREVAYMCPAGVWTIGWGTTQYPDGRKVGMGDTCTPELAESWLRKVLERDRRFVARYLNNIPKPLNDNQTDALTSFVYNIGFGTFATSTLVKKLKDGKEDPADIAKVELPRWNKVKGKVLSGLIRRREAELALFLGTPIPTPPDGV